MFAWPWSPIRWPSIVSAGTEMLKDTRTTGSAACREIAKRLFDFPRLLRRSQHHARDKFTAFLG